MINWDDEVDKWRESQTYGWKDSKTYQGIQDLIRIYDEMKHEMNRVLDERNYLRKIVEEKLSALLNSREKKLLKKSRG